MAPVAPVGQRQQRSQDPGLGLLHLTPLPLQQCALPGEPPAIAAEIAVAPDHPMARDDQCDWIGGARSGDRAGTPWCTHGLGDFGVAPGLASRNHPEGVPHPMLKCGSAQVERDVRPRCLPVELPQDLPGPRLHSIGILQDPGVRETCLKLGLEGRVGVSQADTAHPLFAGGDQEAPNGRVEHCVPQGERVDGYVVDDCRCSHRFLRRQYWGRHRPDGYPDLAMEFRGMVMQAELRPENVGPLTAGPSPLS